MYKPKVKEYYNFAFHNLRCNYIGYNVKFKSFHFWESKAWLHSFLSKSNVNMKSKEKQAFLNGTSSLLLSKIYTQMPKHFEHLANVYKSDVN